MARKRKAGDGTVRQRKDGRWEGRIVIGYDDNGYPKTKNVLAKTKKECVEKLQKLKEECGGLKPEKVRSEMPFGDWMEHWYETHSRPAARPGTRRIYEGYLRLYINPGLGHIPLNRLTAKDMQQFFTWLKTEGRADQSDGETGLADSQLRNIHSLCRRALEKAVSEDLIPQNPASGCKLPPKKAREMQVLTREELQRFLIQAKFEGYYEVFLLDLATGLRRGELLALQWSDLNVKERILTVNKQVTRMEGELDVTEPKTKNSVRKVALSQQAVDLLVQEHEQHPDNPILFPSPRTGGYWSPDAVSRINRKLLKNAGIEEHVRFHDLRHTFATMAISSGVDVKTLSSMLGHFSAGFTLDTYTHITNDMQRGAAEKIGGFMESATATTTLEPPDPPGQIQCKVIPFERVG